MIALLRQLERIDGTRCGAHVYLWCPGCYVESGHGTHSPGVLGDDGSHPQTEWTWNGDLLCPSFEPSYLTWTGDREKPDTRCHSFIRNGQWQYLSDCTHTFAGKTVNMIELPKWLARE